MKVDPDNPVLSHLRDIRAEIALIRHALDDHGKRFDKLDERFDPQDQKLSSALRFAALANLGAQNAEVKALEVAEKQEVLEQRMADFDRRLKKMEGLTV